MGATVLSPAKVNLYLKIVARRPDGYHDLYSLVDLISLYDTIHIEEIPGDKIIVDDDKGILPHGDANTVYAAIRLLKDATGTKRGIRIFIEKNIPIGSGLGGPSSDAATVLKALCEYWELALNAGQLAAIGKRV
ncbi:MAG: 4-(cytidine 5'-diphospho)-2-C-methyl-D-erythritol kinase, partial [Syntrophorhabdaceae bacterium]